MRACSECGNDLDERGESSDTGVCIFCVSNAQHRKWYPHLYPEPTDVKVRDGQCRKCLSFGYCYFPDNCGRDPIEGYKTIESRVEGNQP